MYPVGVFGKDLFLQRQLLTGDATSLSPDFGEHMCYLASNREKEVRLIALVNTKFENFSSAPVLFAKSASMAWNTASASTV